MSDKEEKIITIRFPKELITRIDKVGEKIQGKQQGISVTRSEMIRLATYRGIGLLETENLEAKKKK
jgi:hypothetical protein